MQNKRFNLGPVALTASVANYLNPAAASGGVNGGSSAQYVLLYSITLVNQGGTARTVRLYRGATGGSAAGTELCPQDLPIAPNGQQVLSFPGGLRFDSGDFLSAVASAASAVTLSAQGEVGVAG